MERDGGREVEMTETEVERERGIRKVSGCQTQNGKLSEKGRELAAHNSNNVRSRPCGWRFVERDEKMQ